MMDNSKNESSKRESCPVGNESEIKKKVRFCVDENDMGKPSTSGISVLDSESPASSPTIRVISEDNLDSDDVTEFFLSEKGIEKEQEKRITYFKGLMHDALGEKVHKTEEEEKKTVSKTAVVFKTEPNDKTRPDPFVSVLENEGIRTYLIPSLTFEFLLVHDLQKALKAPEMFAGIIFSSVRAVHTIKQNLDNIKDDDDKIRVLNVWRSKLNFAVFKTTAAAAKAEFDIEAIGCTAGCMLTLFAMIKASNNPEGFKPYLYPCSFEDNQRSLPETHGVKVRKVPCYKTLPHPGIVEAWQKTLTKIKGLPEYIMFFSPSAVRTTFQLLRKYGLSMFKMIAIGPSTANHLSNLHVEPAVVPNKPSPEEFADALHEYLYPTKPDPKLWQIVLAIEKEMKEKRRKEREREKEAAKEIEIEVEKELEMKKQLEKEMNMRKEQEMKKQLQKEIEMQKEEEMKKQLRKEMKAAREREQQREKEEEREAMREEMRKRRKKQAMEEKRDKEREAALKKEREKEREAVREKEREEKEREEEEKEEEREKEREEEEVKEREKEEEREKEREEEEEVKEREKEEEREEEREEEEVKEREKEEEREEEREEEVKEREAAREKEREEEREKEEEKEEEREKEEEKEEEREKEEEKEEEREKEEEKEEKEKLQDTD